MIRSPALSNVLIGLGGLLLIAAVGKIFDTYLLFNYTVYSVLSIFAISLGFVWGFGGILSMGHAVFLGIGGYAFAVASLNGFDSVSSIAVSIVVPMIMAAILGWFIFYGRVGNVYIGVISLAFCLIFYSIAANSSDGALSIGTVQLGGYNGIPGIPPITIPFFAPDGLDYDGMFYFCAVLLLGVFLGVRLLLQSSFGRVVVSLRENELRAELLGYDVRFVKLATFAISAGIAGLSGALYAAWAPSSTRRCSPWLSVRRSSSG